MNTAEPIKNESAPHNLLFSVFTKRILGVVGGVCLLTAFVLGAIGLFVPSVLNNEISKWVACIVFSLTFAIPFFILWPHDAQAGASLSGWNLTGLAGPVVLFIGLFLLLLSTSPNVAGTTRFIAVELRGKDGNLLGQPREVLDFSTQATDARIDKVIDNSDPENNAPNLRGIVIQFPSQLEVKVKVSSRTFNVEPEIITLNAKTDKVHLIITPKKK